MSEEQTTPSYTPSEGEQSQAAPQGAQTPPPSQPQSDKTDAVKAAQGDALTPDQKHKNYLDDIERLHNEP